MPAGSQVVDDRRLEEPSWWVDEAADFEELSFYDGVGFAHREKPFLLVLPSDPGRARTRAFGSGVTGGRKCPGHSRQAMPMGLVVAPKNPCAILS